MRHEDAATAVVAGDHSDPISFLEVHRILIVPVVLALGGYMFNLSQKLAVLRQLDGKGKKNVLLFLREARLVHGAIGITEEELAQQDYSLEAPPCPTAGSTRTGSAHFLEYAHGAPLHLPRSSARILSRKADKPAYPAC